MGSVAAIKYIIKQLSYFKGFTFQSFLLMILMALVNLPLPLMNKVVIDYVIPTGDIKNVVLVGLLAFYVRGTSSVFQVAQNYAIRQVMASIAHRLRGLMVNSLLMAEYSKYSNGEISDLIGRLSGDVTKLETMIFDSFRFVLRPICMISVVLIVMGLISLPATILMMLIAPASVFLTRFLSEKLKRLERLVLEKREVLQSKVAEVLDNIKLVRCFNKENYYSEKISGHISDYTDFSIDYAGQKFIMQNAIEFLTILPWMVMVVGGAMMINSELAQEYFPNTQLSLGDFMAFITFEQLLRTPLAQLALFVLRIKSEIVGPERVEEVININRESCNKKEVSDISGAIKLDHLHFSYPASKKDVLSGVCESVKAGERIAIVGGSGAGKSTLFNLLLGFYIPTKGRIMYDEYDITDIDLFSLRKHIGVVFQDNPMFNETIRYNITFGENIEDTKVWEAPNVAGAKEFVNELPDKLDTFVGEKGLKLSGGQRQRIAIARVWIKNPKIILMDEATSSLDSVSELKIKYAMDSVLKNRTSITIAHRLSTIVEADRILYMENGLIIEQGNHKELLDLKGKYYHLYSTQTEGLIIKNTV